MIKLRKLILFTIYNLIAVALIFIIVEGFASTAIMVYRIWNMWGWGVAETVHTEYDDSLGWVNLPNLYVKNMYGPGIYFKTNGQRFRNNHEISPQIPINKVRIICSGDSFTLGYGVDNDHTWCHQLVSINPKLETVNMGQGGYGIDQAYLWYKRDGSKLKHDIHIFAFVTSDFDRMQTDNFVGYGKPILELKDNVLVIHNVPVPKPPVFKIYLNRLMQYRMAFLELSSVKIFQRLLFKNSDVSDIKNKNKTKEVAMKIFQDLDKLNKNNNSILLLVYLPVKSDYSKFDSEPWRQFLHNQAERQNIFFIDLIDEFRKLPIQNIGPMFISQMNESYMGAAGHYTDKGNSYIAKVLYDKLCSVQKIADKIGFKSSGVQIPSAPPKCDNN